MRKCGLNGLVDFVDEMPRRPPSTKKENMKLTKTAFFSALFLMTSVAFSQTKFESEIRIKDTQIPSAARTFIDSVYFTKKVKWYREIGLNSTSVEAKTKHKGKRYSVEFSPDGRLEDAEIEIDMTDIEQNIRCNIVAYFYSVYDKYRIDKVQIQYTGAENNMLSTLRTDVPDPAVTINYEIVMNAKTEGIYKRFEYLFDESGEFIEKSEVVLKNTNNLQY